MWLLSQDESVLINLDRTNSIYRSQNLHSKNWDLKVEDNKDEYIIGIYDSKEKINKVMKKICTFISCNNEKIYTLPKNSEVKI